MSKLDGLDKKWEKEYRDRFTADYLSWGVDETTDGAVMFIKKLISQARQEEREALKKILDRLSKTGQSELEFRGYQRAISDLLNELK